MSFEKEVEKLSYNKKLNDYVENLKIEIKTEVESELVKKVLCFNPQAKILNTSLSDGEAEITGVTTFFIGYLTVDSQIKKVECGSEFKKKIKLDKNLPQQRIKTSISIEKTEIDLSSIKMTAIIHLKLTVTEFNQETATALVGGNGLITNLKEIELTKNLAKKQSTLVLDEEFELNCLIKEVLCLSSSAVVSAVQCGVNSIIVDGEAYLTLILLQCGEKRDIIKETRKVPFRFEIECEDAMPQTKAIASAEVKSFKTDISCDETKNLSLIKLEASLIISGEAFNSVAINIADDVFSLTHQLEAKKDTLVNFEKAEQRIFRKSINERVEIDELMENSTLVVSASENVEIVSTEKKKEEICVSGVINTTQIFKNAEDEFFAKKVQIPFECGLEFDIGDECSITAVLEKTESTQLSLSQLDFNANVVFTIYPSVKNQITYISDVTQTQEKSENPAGISVYLGINGETLWELAKRLNISQDKLLQLNKNITFPLTGEERIVIYRQK